MKKIVVVIGVALLMAACQKEEITRTGIAKDHFYFENRGATMPVYLEGNISSNKILIMIHGGPGDGALYFNTPEATDIAEKEFAIAYWDQRAAGISQGNTMSVKLNDYTDDLRKLIILLRNRYGNSKEIYLLGHSWGGLIAPLFLEEGNNQSLVKGWIQVDGEHNYAMADSLIRTSLIEFGKQEIAAERHKSDWQEIVDYCSSHDPKGNYEVSRKINGYAHDSESYIKDITEGRSTKENVKYFIREYRYPITTFLSNGVYNNLIKEIDRQAYAENVSSKLNKITLPTLLLWGKYDFVCPIGLSENISSKISSTDVNTIVFNNSGHNPMNNEPIVFWNTVTDWVKAH
jgi:pimeloyl-ACP methyl ester carboxylesterase